MSAAAVPAACLRTRLSRQAKRTDVPPAPNFETSTRARAKLPTLILKEVGRTIGSDGTERRTNGLAFEGMDISDGTKVLAESLGIEEEVLLNLLGELAGV